MILGPDDPRALRGEELANAREYTKRFNKEVLGLNELTPEEQAKKDALLDEILDVIGWEEPDA